MNEPAPEPLEIVAPAGGRIDLAAVKTALERMVAGGPVKAAFHAKGMNPFVVRIAGGDLSTVRKLLRNAATSRARIERVVAAMASKATRGNPARAPRRSVAIPREGMGWAVETFLGGQYGPVSFHARREDAERERDRLEASGRWSGMPPRVVDVHSGRADLLAVLDIAEEADAGERAHARTRPNPFPEPGPGRGSLYWRDEDRAVKSIMEARGGKYVGHLHFAISGKTAKELVANAKSKLPHFGHELSVEVAPGFIGWLRHGTTPAEGPWVVWGIKFRGTPEEAERVKRILRNQPDPEPSDGGTRPNPAPSQTVVSSDPFARVDVVREKASGECAWCGAPAKFRYGSHAHGISTRPEMQKRVFCSRSCERSYNS